MKNFAEEHAASVKRVMTGNVLVAHVNVGDESLTVEANKVYEALVALHGAPFPGMRVNVIISFDVMSREAFDAIPEYQ